MLVLKNDSELRMNDSVSLMYSGKLRTGRVENIGNGFFTLATEKGYRTFRFNRIENRRHLNTGIVRLI